MKLNENRFLQNDMDAVKLNTKEELEEYLKFRKENDEWISCYINDLGAVGIPNLPLFIPGNCKDIIIKRPNFTIEVEDIDYEGESNKECIANTGLFLVIPYRNKMVPFPTRWIAYGTICQRTDDLCGTMTRFDEKVNKSVLPIDEKAERLTRDFALYSDRCNILFRDGMVSACLSKEYVILPCDELIQTLENALSKEHPNMEFVSGQVSHEFLIAQYNLNNRMMEEELRLKLNNIGGNINTLKAGVQFSSSDVGLSSVCANIYFDMDGTTVFLAGIKMSHKGDASTGKFAEELEDFDNIMKESEEAIEKLGNMDISDVASVVEQITEEYSSIFPNKASEEVIEDLRVKCSSSGTGVDVFIALNDIVGRHFASSKVSPTRYLQMTEQVSKLIKLPFDKIDAGEYQFSK